MWHLYKTGGITPAVASMFGAQSAQQMAFIRSIVKEQRHNSLFELSLEDMEVVVFDLETTGFSPYNGDEIISIGAIAVVGDKLMENETFYTLVHPERTIPVEIERLTGITNEKVREAPQLIVALHQFLQFIRKRVLVVHGSGHDKHFLNSALWRTSKVNLTHRLLDTMMIAKWLQPKLSSYALDDLLHNNGIAVHNRHHALEDACMTAKLYIHQLEEIAERQVTTMGDLYAYLSRH